METTNNKKKVKMKKCAYPPACVVAVLSLTCLVLSAYPGGAGSLPAAGGEGGGRPDGQRVLLDQGCNMCHSVKTAGIEAKVGSGKMAGPDLSGATERRQREWIAAFIKHERELDGKRHLKKFTGTDDELTALLDWLHKQEKAE